MSISHRIAVVGGGASGVLTAINLLATDTAHTLSVTIHEASGILGRGIAYGTRDPRHLLNVRARHMSAFPDVPSDLLDWAARTGRDVDPHGFLPRMEYAAYLQDRLAAVADHRLTVRAGQVDDLVPTPDGFEVHAAGVVSPADAVVLAYGNQRPRPLTVDGDVLPEASWHLPDPWDLAALHRLAGRRVRAGRGLRADRDRHCHHRARGSPGPAGDDGEPARPAPASPCRATVHRLGQPRADRHAHGRPPGRALRGAGGGRGGQRGRLARRRRRPAQLDPEPLAAARPRRACSVAADLRPPLGGTPAPDGACGGGAHRRLPARRTGSP